MFCSVFIQLELFYKSHKYFTKLQRLEVVKNFLKLNIFIKVVVLFTMKSDFAKNWKT